MRMYPAHLVSVCIDAGKLCLIVDRASSQSEARAKTCLWSSDESPGGREGGRTGGRIDRGQERDGGREERREGWKDGGM